jgi:PDZ domain
LATIGQTRPKQQLAGEIGMHVSVLALIGLAIAGDSSLPPDVVEIQYRTIGIPFYVEPGKQNDIECLRLFVSQDRGKTWQRQAECKPNEKHFHFVAPDDGLYWFAMQIVGKNGAPEPAKVSDLLPIQKVYVNADHRDIKHDKTYGELSEEVTQLRAAVKRLCSPVAEPDAKLVLASFDVPKHGDFLVLPVTIDGQTYKFGVDTGATRTIFDISLRQHTGEPGEKLNGKSSLGKALEVETRYPLDAQLGELDLDLPCDAGWRVRLFGIIPFEYKHRLPVPLLDLSALRKLTGYDIRGIIGMDILRQHVVRIDFEKGKLWLLKAATDGTEPRAKIAWDKNGLPTVEARVADKALEPFLIDTGHGGGAMAGDVERQIFQDLVQRKMVCDVEDDQSANDFSGNEKKTQSGMPQSFEMGIFKHDDLLFAAGDRCILGLSYWSRYVVTLDFPNSVIYLTPVPHYQLRIQRHCSSGVSLVGVNGSIMVDTVKQGTAAARAGVQAGDIIMAIDNQSMRGASVFDAYVAIQNAGDRPPLSIRRGKESRQLTLLLASQKVETNNGSH